MEIRVNGRMPVNIELQGTGFALFNYDVKNGPIIHFTLNEREAREFVKKINVALNSPRAGFVHSAFPVVKKAITKIFPPKNDSQNQNKEYQKYLKCNQLSTFNSDVDESDPEVKALWDKLDKEAQNDPTMKKAWWEQEDIG